MFDISSAVILGLVVLGLIAIAKTLYEGSARDRIIVAICFLVSLVTVVLVAASDFASEQVVLDRPLSTLNFGSQLVVVILLTGTASAAYEGLKAVKNIGENHSP